MADRTNKQFPASFRGINFFIRSESMPSGGRKIVLHDYPDSDQRYVEDLGELPPIFSCDAFVSGYNWREQSFVLEQELRTAGPGELVLPDFGSNVVYAMPYSKDASQQSVGIISFRLEFATGKPSTAGVATPTLPIVFDNGDKSRLGIKEKFAKLMKAASFVQNSLNDISDLVDVADEMIRNFESVIELEFLEKYKKQIDDIKNRASSLTSNPVSYANSFVQGDTLEDGMWQLTSVGLGEQGAVDAALELTTYGSTLLESEAAQTVNGSSVLENSTDETSLNTPYWPETTAERIQRNDSRRLVVRTMRLNALILAYEQLAAGTYNTTDEINEARDKVETAYNTIMLEGTTDATAIQAASEIRPLIEDVRTVALSVVAQKEQEVFGLMSINQNYKIPQFALGYLLYAEEFTDSELLTDRSRVVRGLNPNVNGLQMKGTLEILQTEGL